MIFRLLLLAALAVLVYAGLVAWSFRVVGEPDIRDSDAGITFA